MGEEKIIYKDKETNNINAGIWKRFILLIWKSKLPFVWIGIYIILSMVAVKIGINVPAYTAELFNGNVSVSLVTMLVMATLASLFIQNISNVFQDIAAARIDRNLRTMLWDKMLSLPVPFFEENKPREMVSRITKDTERVSSLIMREIIGELMTLYLIYETAKQLVNYDMRLMYSLFIFIPILILIAFIFGRLMFRTMRGAQYRVSRLTQVLAELVSNVPLIKSFAKEDKEEERGKGAITKLYKANISVGMVNLFQFPVFSIVNLLQTILIVLTGMYFLNNGDITTTMWTAYFLYVNNLVNVINSKAGFWTQIKTSQGATDRISRIMEEAEETYDVDKAVGDLQGDISFQNLSFKFEDQEVLKDISCNFEVGKITALVGLSGCGKTTMLNLIHRFYMPLEGRIIVGNQNINDYNLTDYRRSIAYVSQNSGIMSGTIKDNLLYGIERNVEEDEIIQAAKLGNAYEFIQNFEQGFDTEVGEHGNKLSGGQKQRIAITRAILKNPKYLLLDEASANLDANAAEEVLYGLKNLMKDRTVIMVTHDPKSMQIADEIIVLENGRIAGQGSHKKLRKENNYYREVIDRYKEEEEGNE